MKKVNFERYRDVVRRLPHEWAHPLEGENICAMQWVAPDNDLIAKAVYHRGMAAQYYVTSEIIKGVTDDAGTKSNAPA